MPAAEVVISAPHLAEFIRQLLLALKVPVPEAELVAESLVAAGLRGVDSHGAQLLPFYIEQLEAGEIDPAASGRVVSESGACMVYDGENGVGQAIAAICCDHAARLARSHGLGMVVAREANHFGAAAFWGQRLSAAGCIGVVMCNASPLVPPWQAREPRFGTNPICVSVPGGAEPPWLLDMATTTVAAGKIYKAMVNGLDAIPPGWAMDHDGVPTTSAQAAVNGLLMPLGGYKGSGLAMLVEILSAVLSGGAMSTEVSGIRIRGRSMRVNHAFLAIDASRFLPASDFAGRMDRLIGMVKSAAPTAGYSEVLVAGDPERRSERERRASGIPVGRGTWEKLCEAAARHGVGLPVVRSL